MTAYSELANPRATRAVLEEFGLRAKHALGQNFLIDDNVIGHILRMANLTGSTLCSQLPCVLEIGPGIGTLTVALLERADVIAIERDCDLVEVLEETTAFNGDRLALLNEDALKVTQSEIEEAAQGLRASLPKQLVSNLPYGIAATVVLDWLERLAFLEAMTVMVQAEVADRMCAQPGTKEYGAYTVKLNLLAEVTDRFEVPPSCFMPAPHVDSAVVHIERKRQDASADLLATACKLADAAFSQRRKTIRNSMQSRYDRDVVDALLASCDVSPTIRGERLEPSVFLKMARSYQELA